MSSFKSRLRKVETRLNPMGKEPKETFEIHHLQAWPDCDGAEGMQQCHEHPPSCGVSITHPSAWSPYHHLERCPLVGVAGLMRLSDRLQRL